MVPWCHGTLEPLGDVVDVCVGEIGFVWRKKKSGQLILTYKTSLWLIRRLWGGVKSIFRIQPAYLSISIWPTISQSIYQSNYLFICLSMYVSISLSIYLSIHPDIFPPLHLSISPSPPVLTPSFSFLNVPNQFSSPIR